MKYSFYNDYSEGAHPQIIEALAKTNLVQQAGYGEDEYTRSAISQIKRHLNNQDADVHLVSGGTQANLINLAAMMKPYEGTIAAQSGHIAVHEAGAIEATGHKIITVKTTDGKLTPELIGQGLSTHEDEHTVKPKVVFISLSTELGTVYNENELRSISEFCRKKDLYLYLDGARLGSGLMSAECDLDLEKLARYVDIFYIGGTKNGALLGEAIVITREELKKDFRYHIKQRGGLLAKGRILGVQFDVLFREDLYFELAKHANKIAQRLTQGITEKGYKFLTKSSTNQIFPIFPNQKISELEEIYGFYRWEAIDENHSAIRLVTCWATKEEMVDEFISDL